MEDTLNTDNNKSVKGKQKHRYSIYIMFVVGGILITKLIISIKIMKCIIIIIFMGTCCTKNANIII